jgi:hypothetical protein
MILPRCGRRSAPQFSGESGCWAYSFLANAAFAMVSLGAVFFPRYPWPLMGTTATSNASLESPFNCAYNMARGIMRLERLEEESSKATLHCPSYANIQGAFRNANIYHSSILVSARRQILPNSSLTD